ncbi:MAG: Crp/Fnr family transcriptional regulator [Actinomycetota bacterium]|nr:Crp/Fnr family transcriptional regulator [Actinomycetota bacterium]MDA8209328.1 Crp/Fnr family transcriptional regulator [Actinomycetota bacterium]
MDKNLSVDIVELLSHTPLFQALEEETLGAVLAYHKIASYRRNQEIFHEDDAANSLFVVLSGRVGIVKSFLDRKESIVAIMETGDLFGEMGLFDQEGRSATARAIERCEVIEVPYAPIRQAIESRPKLLWSLLKLLAGRLRQTDDALTDAMFLDVTGRTAKRIIELAGESDEFTLPLTQEELAGLIGASRERVNKTLATFVRAGYIEVNDRNYRIKNRKQLQIIAG